MADSLGLFTMIFGNRPGSVSLQQGHQVIDPLLKLLALVRIRNFHTFIHLLKDKGIVCNVMIMMDCLKPSGKGMMGNDPHVAGIEDQCVAGNTGGGLICLAEATVDDDQFAAALDGTFAFFGLDGNMTVDDMAVWSVQTEFL